MPDSSNFEFSIEESPTWIKSTRDASPWNLDSSQRFTVGSRFHFSSVVRTKQWIWRATLIAPKLRTQRFSESATPEHLLAVLLTPRETLNGTDVEYRDGAAHRDKAGLHGAH